MKRKPYVNPLEYHDYKKMRSFFTWHKCDICGMEFKNEWGWTIYASPYSCPPISFVSYICGSCIDSEEKMIEHLQTEEARLSFPPKK